MMILDEIAREEDSQTLEERIQKERKKYGFLIKRGKQGNKPEWCSNRCKNRIYQKGRYQRRKNS